MVLRKRMFSGEYPLSAAASMLLSHISFSEGTFDCLVDDSSSSKTLDDDPDASLDDNALEFCSSNGRSRHIPSPEVDERLLNLCSLEPEGRAFEVFLEN